MATALTPQDLANIKALPLTGGAADIVWHAGDTSGNTFVINGPCLLVATNTDSAIHHVSVASAKDGEYGRTGDITSYALPVAAVPAVVTVLGAFKPKGWANATDNLLHVTPDDTHVQLALIKLPQSI